MIEKWWNSNLYRHLVVETIEKSRFSDGSGKLDYDTFMEKRKWLRDKSKDTLSDDKFLTLLENATTTYTQIMIYNQVFESLPTTKEIKSLLLMFGTDYSCKNMKSYGRRVVEFAKTLKELNLTNVNDVIEVLPVLKLNTMIGTAVLNDISGNRKATSDIIDNEVNNIISDINVDSKILLQNIKLGYVRDEVDSELNRLN